MDFKFFEFIEVMNFFLLKFLYVLSSVGYIVLYNKFWLNLFIGFKINFLRRDFFTYIRYIEVDD